MSTAPAADKLRRDHITLTARLEARLDELRGDVGDLKTAMRDLATALTQIALVEERQAQAAAALERAFNAVGKVDARVTSLEGRVFELEKGDVEQSKAASMAERVLLVCAGLVGMYLLKKAGLM
jgi:hypothetical protein